MRKNNKRERLVGELNMEAYREHEQRERRRICYELEQIVREARRRFDEQERRLRREGKIPYMWQELDEMELESSVRSGEVPLARGICGGAKKMFRILAYLPEDYFWCEEHERVELQLLN